MAAWRGQVSSGGGPHLPLLVALQGPPLLHAAAWGEAGMVELLLGAGADVGAADVAGYSALHYACASGHVDTVHKLLQAGADLQ